METISKVTLLNNETVIEMTLRVYTEYNCARKIEPLCYLVACVFVAQFSREYIYIKPIKDHIYAEVGE